MESRETTAGLTVRDRLHALYPATSGRGLKAWLEDGRVRLNGAVVRRGDTPIAPGDHVRLASTGSRAVPSPLSLVHDDEDLVVVDKPAGLLTIATDRERERTAYRLLSGWIASRRARIFVVHRLDRETSGLLVFAKSWAAKRSLQAQFADRSAQRVYVALVEGLVRQAAGTLVSRLAEDAALRVHVVADGRGGKEAISRYRVLDRTANATLVEVTLITGRRGQIRAQLAEIGHPIVGDREYGSRRPARRLHLHATRLGFVHPRGHRVVFESPPPPGFLGP